MRAQSSEEDAVLLGVCLRRAVAARLVAEKLSAKTCTIASCSDSCSMLV